MSNVMAVILDRIEKRWRFLHRFESVATKRKICRISSTVWSAIIVEKDGNYDKVY